MTETVEKANKITRETLLPVGLVVGILIFVFWLGSDWSTAKASIEQNTAGRVANAEAIRELSQAVNEMKIDASYMKEALKRIELKLGTTPG
jgi:hypothetical protein